LINLAGYVDQADPKVTDGAKERLQDLLNEWQRFKTERDAIIDGEMSKYNRKFKALDLPALIIED